MGLRTSPSLDTTEEGGEQRRTWDVFAPKSVFKEENVWGVGFQEKLILILPLGTWPLVVRCAEETVREVES